MKKEWQEEFFERQNELISALTQQINDTIPDEWKEFYFHADINDDFSGGVYFFFNTEEDVNYIYCEDIPEIYNVDEEEYSNERRKLYRLSKSLKQLFIEYEQVLWQAITIIVDEKRTLKMDYDYTECLGSSSGHNEMIDYFEYKYLGKVPGDKEEEELFKKMEEYQSKFNK